MESVLQRRESGIFKKILYDSNFYFKCRSTEAGRGTKDASCYFGGVMEDKSELYEIIAALKMLRDLYTEQHWFASGENFLSTHNFFKDLYESAEKDIDALAEGALGLEWLLPSAQEFSEMVATAFSSFNGVYSNEEAIKLENNLRKCCKEFMDDCVDEGMNNRLAGVCDESLHRVYFLKRFSK